MSSIDDVLSKILCGESRIATHEKQNGQIEAFLHKDLIAAEATIALIRRAQAELGVHVCLAHDDSWLLEQEDPLLLSLLSDQKKGEWLQRVIRQERP